MVAFSSGLIITPNLTARNMASMSMTFEPSIGILARKVDKLGLDIRSFKEPLKRAVQKVVIPSIRMNFHKHGRPDRWPALSELTIAKKGHARMLQDTGALMQTMGQLNIWHIDSEKALIPSLPQSVWYGVVHQQGAGDPEAEADMWFDPVRGVMENVGDSEGINIPQRRFAMVQEEDMDAIDKVFTDWLDERIARAGLARYNTARGRVLG